MWLFLATEIMFFTGLIGSYIVLRIGNKHWPTPESITVQLVQTDKTTKVIKGTMKDEPSSKDEIKFMPEEGEWKGDKLPALPVTNGLVTVTAKDALRYPDGELYEKEDPLNIPLTALNTFILICSSVTMVLALSAIERGDQGKLKFFLFCTIVIGACFLGIQVFEYNKLIHEGFVPSKNIFASCFYVMTGCHGAHVTGGVVYLIGILIAALGGNFTRRNHSAVELAGLYWHFVDLVWILLFTVVYLI